MADFSSSTIGDSVLLFLQDFKVNLALHVKPRLAAMFETLSHTHKQESLAIDLCINFLSLYIELLNQSYSHATQKTKLRLTRNSCEFSSKLMASTTHIVTVLTILSLLACSLNAQLSSNFYATTCPNLQTIVRNAMTQAVNKEARIGASMLRLFFHDCFVNVRHMQMPFVFPLTFFYEFLCVITSVFFGLCRAAMHQYYWTTQLRSRVKRMRHQIETL